MFVFTYHLWPIVKTTDVTCKISNANIQFSCVRVCNRTKPKTLCKTEEMGIILVMLFTWEAINFINENLTSAYSSSDPTTRHVTHAAYMYGAA